MGNLQSNSQVSIKGSIFQFTNNLVDISFLWSGKGSQNQCKLGFRVVLVALFSWLSCPFFCWVVLYAMAYGIWSSCILLHGFDEWFKIRWIRHLIWSCCFDILFLLCMWVIVTPWVLLSFDKWEAVKKNQWKQGFVFILFLLMGIISLSIRGVLDVLNFENVKLSSSFIRLDGWTKKRVIRKFGYFYFCYFDAFSCSTAHWTNFMCLEMWV